MPQFPLLFRQGQIHYILSSVLLMVLQANPIGLLSDHRGCRKPATPKRCELTGQWCQEGDG